MLFRSLVCMSILMEDKKTECILSLILQTYRLKLEYQATNFSKEQLIFIKLHNSGIDVRVFVTVVVLFCLFVYLFGVFFILLYS